MSHRDGRSGRDQRLYRNFNGGFRNDSHAATRGGGGGWGGGGQRDLDGPPKEPLRSGPPAAIMGVRGPLSSRTRRGQYNHRRDRSRSPSDFGAEHCDIKALLQDESIQITVGNDKFRNPLHTGNSVYPSTVSQNSGLPTSRTSVLTHHKYAEETACVARAKEMVMQTREMLSKLAGWNPTSLRLTSAGSSVESQDGPKADSTLNSVHAKLDTSSKISRTVLQNINAAAAAFCPRESGVVARSTHDRLSPGSSVMAANEDEERYLYGEELTPQNLPFGQSGCTTGSVYGRRLLPSVAELPVESREMEDGCDPVVADVLKSIGFNFELSKLMRDKAKRECEEDKNNLHLIRRASLFLAKQLEDVKGLDCPSKDLKSMGDVARVVKDAKGCKRICKDAKPSRILSSGSKEKERILYDAFSNSDDEFCGLEKKMKVAASSNDPSPQPPKPLIRNNSSAVVTLPLNLSFPTPFPVLSAPAVVLPVSSTVLPPPITIPPPQIIFPPPILQHQPLPQQPIWSDYQMPSGTRTVPKKRTVFHPCNEEDWEQTADDFLRKLQEPRTVGGPSKQIPKVVPRSSQQSSSDSERAGKWRRMRERRNRRSFASHTWDRKDSRGNQSDRNSKELSREKRWKKSRNHELSPAQRQGQSTGRLEEKSAMGVEVEKKCQSSKRKIKSEESICFTSETAVKVKREDGVEKSEGRLKWETEEKTDSGNVLKRSKVQNAKKLKIRYDYYDGGDSWCGLCNETFTKLMEFLDHLHGEMHEKQAVHQKTAIERPWLLNRSSEARPHDSDPPISAPASGMEFLKPIQGFFCGLCHQFSGDGEEAEFHMLSEEHNCKFEEYCFANPKYMQNYNIIKSAKMTIRKNRKEKTTGVLCAQEPDCSAKITLGGLESMALKQLKQPVVKKLNIPVRPLSNAVVGKFPHLRAKKKSVDEAKETEEGFSESTLDSENRESSCWGQGSVGASRPSSTVLEVDSTIDVPSQSEHLSRSPTDAFDHYDGSDIDCHQLQSSCSNVCDINDVDMETPSCDLVHSTEDDAIVKLHVRPSESLDVCSLGDASCSLVTYEDPEDHSVIDTMPFGKKQLLSEEHLPEKLEVSNDDVIMCVSDSVGLTSEINTGLINICSLESDRVVLTEDLESDVCPREESLSLLPGEKEMVNRPNCMETCVADGIESFQIHKRAVHSCELGEQLTVLDSCLSETTKSSLDVKLVHDENLLGGKSFESCAVEGSEGVFALEPSFPDGFEIPRAAELRSPEGSWASRPSSPKNFESSTSSAVTGIQSQASVTEAVKNSESLGSDSVGLVTGDDSGRLVKLPAVQELTDFWSAASSDAEELEETHLVLDCSRTDVRAHVVSSDSVEKCGNISVAFSTAVEPFDDDSYKEVTEH